MSDKKIMWGRVFMITAVALAAVFVSGQAYAQGPMNAGPLPGVYPANGPGLPFPPLPGGNLNDPRMNNLIGTALGTFLGYMVQNNMHNDRDHYYNYQDRDPYRNWDWNHGYNGGYYRDRNDWNNYRYYRHGDRDDE